MHRPIYETNEHRVAERSTADVIASTYGLTMVALPLKSQVDYMGWSDEGKRVRAFFEMKRRKVSRFRYETLMLSLHKVLAMIDIDRSTGIPVMLAVTWDDGTGLLRVANVEKPLDVQIGGRWDRNDPQDVEPVVHFDVNKFRMIQQGIAT